MKFAKKPGPPSRLRTQTAFGNRVLSIVASQGLCGVRGVSIKGWLHLVLHRLQRCVLLAATMLAALASTAEAKLPGSVHCFNDICHRVRTVAETEARRGLVESVVASFYDAPDRDRFNPRSETSSGARFDPDADDNAASPIHPDGTVLLLWSPVTRAAAVVRVNNAGPYYPGRTLDVSRAVAERLGFRIGGTMELLATVIAAPSETEAHYVRGRSYAKVRGFLGTFDTIASAGTADAFVRAAIEATGLVAAGLTTPDTITPSLAEEYIRWNDLLVACEAVAADVLAPLQPPADTPFALLAPADDFSPTQATDANPEPQPLSIVALAEGDASTQPH